MRQSVILLLLVLGTGAVASVQEAPPQICFTTMSGPFTVTSGAPFNISWIMSDSVLENNVSVPSRVNGFYIQVDGDEKDDIGMATALTQCPSTAIPYPSDYPYTYKTTKGVSRGSHMLKISAWNYTLDSNGDPTTTRQESVVANIPFSAGDPIQYGPPVSPTNVVIFK